MPRDYVPQFAIGGVVDFDGPPPSSERDQLLMGTRIWLKLETRLVWRYPATGVPYRDLITHFGPPGAAVVYINSGVYPSSLGRTMVAFEVADFPQVPALRCMYCPLPKNGRLHPRNVL